MMAELFPNLIKTINAQIEEAQKIPTRMNTKKTIPWYIIINVLKTCDKEKKILKAAGGGGDIDEQKDKNDNSLLKTIHL